MNERSTRRDLAYAAGGMAMNLTNLVISQWLIYLYVPDIGSGTVLIPVIAGALVLSAGTVFGLFFSLGRLTDAITDPLVAYWSDQHRSPRGRRVPFILWGLIPFCVVYFLLWTPPVAGASWWNSAYIFVLIQAYFILYTIVVTPYLALLPELTTDLKERVNITTLQAVFVMVGTFAFGAVGPLIEHVGWWALGLLVAVMSAISFLPSVLWIKERPQPPVNQADQVGLVQWVAMTVKNKPFVYLMASTSFYWFGLNLLIMLVPAWVEAFVGLKKDAVPLLMGPFLVVNTVFFFVFNVLAKKFGKYPLYLFTCAGSALAVLLFMLAGSLPGSPAVQSAVIMGVIGIPSAGFMMLPFAILSDVADYDEALYGKRREAIFFGTQAITQKSAIALSILVFPILSRVDGHFTTEGLKGVAIAAAISFGIALATFLGYPLREQAGRVALKQ